MLFRSQARAVERLHLSDHQVNILSATSTTRRDRTTTLRFTFQLADIAHLAGLLAAIRGVEGVFEAYRVVPR